MYLFSERPLAHTHYNGRAPTMVLTRARYKLRFARISDHFFIRFFIPTKNKEYNKYVKNIKFSCIFFGKRGMHDVRVYSDQGTYFISLLVALDT